MNEFTHTPDCPAHQGEPCVCVPAITESAEPVVRKPDIRSFPKGVARNVVTDGSSTPEQSTPKPTKNALIAMREDRRKRAYKLWLENVPMREIGQQLGCGTATAWRAVEAYRLAMRASNQLSLERSRDKQKEQHELNQRRILAAANSSTLSAQAVAMLAAEMTRSIEAVSKLTGTNAPVKVASTTPDGSQWAPLSFALQAASTEELLVLKKFTEMRVLGDAKPMAAQVVDAEIVKAG